MALKSLLGEVNKQKQQALGELNFRENALQFKADISVCVLSVNNVLWIVMLCCATVTKCVKIVCLRTRRLRQGFGAGGFPYGG